MSTMAPETKAEPRQRFSMLQSLLGGRKNKQQYPLGEPVRETRDDASLPFQPSVVRSYTMPMITTDPLASHPVRLESLQGSITDGTSSSGSSISGLSMLGDMAAVVGSSSAPATPGGGEQQQVWSGRPTARASVGAVTGLQALFADPNDIAIFSSPVTASPATSSPASPSNAETENHKFKGNLVRGTRASRLPSRVFGPHPQPQMQQPSPLSASEEPAHQRSVSTPIPGPVAAPAQLPPRPSSSSGATTTKTAMTNPQMGLMLQIPQVPQKSVQRIWNPTGGRFRSPSQAPPSPIAEEGVDLPSRPVTVWGSKAWEGVASPATAAAPWSAVEVVAPRAWCSNLTTKDIGSLTPQLRSAEGGKPSSQSPICCLPEIDRGPSLSAIFAGPLPTLTPASVHALAPAPAAVKPLTRRHTSPIEVYELEGSSTDEDIYDDDYDDDDSLRHSTVSDVSSFAPSDACPSSLSPPPPLNMCPPLDTSSPMTMTMCCSPVTSNGPSPMTPLGSIGDLTFTVSPIMGGGCNNNNNNNNKQYKAFRPGLVRAATDLGQAMPRPRDTSKAACEAWVRRSQLFQMNEKMVPMRRHIPEC